MLRLIFILLLFTVSLLNFFPVPSKELWYLGILIPEYPWIFMLAMILLLTWSFFSKRFRTVCIGIGAATLIFFTYPIVRAYIVGSSLDEELAGTFGFKPGTLTGFHQEKPFSFWQQLTGDGAKKIPFTTYQYAVNGGQPLTLNFSRSAIAGIRPCLFVVHGGSWKRGDNSEIAAINNYFANAGYQVATINYRLAPKYHSPAPQEDVQSALTWLKQRAVQLQIDTTKFVLLGRSAGAQIALTKAYVHPEPGIKGVMEFYGPNDMLWSYQHPDNPRIMDSRLVQRDFLGGAPNKIPGRYLAESPFFFITPKTVPTLIVHGKVDAHVYYEQSVRLHKKLNDAGVRNLFLSLPWATHGCEYNLNGPSGQLSVYAMERFMFAVTH